MTLHDAIMVQQTRDAIVFGPAKHETMDEPVDVLVEPADDVNMDDPLDNGAKDRWTNLGGRKKDLDQSKLDIWSWSGRR